MVPSEIEDAVLSEYQALFNLKAKTLDAIVVGPKDENERMAFDALVQNVEESLGIDGPRSTDPPHRLTDLVRWFESRIQSEQG
jgi:hypothetical protein